MHKLPALFTHILNIIFPPRCVGCASSTARNETLCAPCKNSITLNTAFFCSVCKRRIPVISGRVKKCICKNSFIVGAAASYAAQPVRSMIHALKYRRIQAPAAPCGELLSRFIVQSGLDIENYIVTPMPLGRARLKDRGFNQAERVATHFGACAGKGSPIRMAHLLVRTRDTLPQANMTSLQKRRENVEGCFALAAGIPPLADANILLVDDVFTSGTTSGEAVRVLKKAGAKLVIVLTIARS